MNFTQQIVLYGSLLLIVVFYYLRKIDSKKSELEYFEEGICPKCKSENVSNIKLKSGGCSGTSEYKFECFTCGYKDSYNLTTNGCDIDSGVDESTIKF